MAPWELEQLPLSPKVCPCMNTSLYLCFHVPSCARRGVETLTNPFRDINCDERDGYFFLGSLFTCSVSLQPPLTFIFSLYFSIQYLSISLLRVSFSALPSFIWLGSAVSLLMRGQPRYQSRVVSIHLIHLMLIVSCLHLLN